LEVASDLRECRHEAQFGFDLGGQRVPIHFDRHCGHVRLCPDEAREETMRLAERYIPQILLWLKGKRTRRLFFVVFTVRTVPEGELLKQKHFMFHRLQSRVFDRPVYSRLSDRKVVSRKLQKGELPDWPQIKGALVCQEDPLSKDYQWHVHQNAFLLVDGGCPMKGCARPGVRIWKSRKSRPRRRSCSQS
jgi:hypothetical protein